jgi:hypothetical protein
LLARSGSLCPSIAELVDRDDVRVLEAGRRPGLAEEAFPHPGLRQDVRQHGLEGDDAVEDRVPGLVDRAHPTAAKLGENLVLADPVRVRGHSKW